jgi:hypothetical protein
VEGSVDLLQLDPISHQVEVAQPLVSRTDGMDVSGAPVVGCLPPVADAPGSPGQHEPVADRPSGPELPVRLLRHHEPGWTTRAHQLALSLVFVLGLAWTPQFPGPRDTSRAEARRRSS